MQTKIYALCEPNGEIRYIGKTIGKLGSRLSKHLWEAHKGDRKDHKNYWIRSMFKKGLQPSMQIIGEVAGDGNDAEIAWISYGRSEKWDLTNSTDGGEGYIPTKETRMKLRLAKLGKRPSEISIMKMSLSHKGKKSWNKGLKTPEEVKIKQSKSHTGLKFSQNHKNKISNGHIGLHPTQEVKNKISAKQKGVSRPYMRGVMGKKIIQMDKNGNFIKKFNSLIDAQNIAAGTNISQVCQGKRKTAGGYKWIFDNNEDSQLPTAKVAGFLATSIMNSPT